MAQAPEPRPAPQLTLALRHRAARMLLPANLLAVAFAAFFITSTDWAGALIFWSFALCGIGLVSRLPRQPIGWLVLGLGLTFVLVGSSPPGSASQVVDGRANLRVTLQAWGNGWGAGLFFVGLITLPAIFPSGHLPPGRMGLANRLAIAMAALFTLAQAFAPSFVISFADGTAARVTNPIGIGRGWAGWPIFSEGIFFVFLVALAVALGTFLLRFRRARDAERQQYKWLLFALGGVLGAFIFAFAMIAFVDPNGTWMWFPAVVAYPMVPMAIGIAVLRYRLYDIDRVISRTLAYGIVTLVLAGLFTGLVLGIQAVAHPVTGTSEVAVAISTLVVFALFGPLRRRVQRTIDHRFDRTRYDAALVAAGFGARLRDHFDVEAVRGELTRTAHASLSPGTASVWVRTRPSGDIP